MKIRQNILSWLGVTIAVVAVLDGGCGPSQTAPVNQRDNPTSTGAGRQASDRPSEPGPEDVAPASGGPTATQPPAPMPDPPVLLTEEELAEGWISLFDGQTLYGWQAASQANWSVKDGTITADAGEQGLLYTTTQFANYVLKIDFRCEEGANSGIFLHTPPVPQDPAKDCYELNIADQDNPFPTGSLVFRQKVETPFDSADWQSYEVTVRDGQVTARLNGQPVLDYADPHPLQRGHIGLQFRSGGIAFRKIKLKPLGLTSIFNGKDLTGWKTYPEMPSVFTVTKAGELNVKNGRGQLETEQSYGDFVLQFECITLAEDLNGGIFFRCIPGEEMNGYESQIFNKFADHDRNKPLDSGTGGIFRRQDARRIVADDLEWFHETLIADGAHFAVWVNGYQVNDWTDQRPPDPNPRRGLRLEPGTIMIQGHDPTTDISFRNMRIATLPPRKY